MKYLALVIVFLSYAHANPLKEMDRKLEVYGEVKQMTCDPTGVPSDAGISMDVSCEFKCQDNALKIEHAKAPFVPSKLGLFPGNGSNDQQTLWSSVGVSMKIWSHRICLEKAAEGCKGIQQVTEVKLRNISSGKWKLDKFPGCHEKSITLSPFNDDAGSIRVEPEVAKFTLDLPKDNLTSGEKYELDVKGLTASITLGKVNVQLQNPVFDTKSCQKIIKAKLCYGDCIDLSDTKNITETLGTAEPLGHDEVEVCADDLVKKLQNEKLSPSLREQLCENYFWQSFLKLDYRLFKSCAALRGEVDCKGF